MIATFSFRCLLPEGVDPDQLTTLELARLIVERDAHPLVDLPWTVKETEEVSS